VGFGTGSGAADMAAGLVLVGAIVPPISCEAELVADGPLDLGSPTGGRAAVLDGALDFSICA